MLRLRVRSAVPAAVLLGGLTVVAPPLEAHPAAEPDPPSAPAPMLRAPTGPDFLFGAPHGSLSLRIGRLFARTEGGVFERTFANLSAEPDDFDGLTLGADLALRVVDRADLVVGVGFARATVDSEFNDWLDENGQPIRQTTRFRQIPVTLGARLYLTPRGREISRFAWVPARTTFYVGGGAGLIHHLYEQEGEFVDETSLDIFADHLSSSGWSSLVYVGAGAELRVTTSVALVADVRYTRGSARATGDFREWEDIGLGGLATSVGVALTF
ncbi:MAG: hypothetical protein DIU52_005040 [bacterium]|jgi:opacity protein-like surface antigen